MQTAILAGGCFWCIESAFNRLVGVKRAVSGYCGGTEATANYQAVCTGNTDHAEAVKVEFDETIISYLDILSIFFDLHDPTQLNRQGNDIGRQYRSVIFYLNEEQQRQAVDFVAKQQAHFSQAIVTEIVPNEAFYTAEGYHQNYYEHNSRQPYCQVVISPKLQKIADKYADKLKS
ncbi:peptide-methionine (S)-S-oxide reductase MsrA [Catenovulum sediminis]|uniref:Peptide methionine sulfoxide reductase MsrA n=1 Tax=Catenovulum sediminis TaxID=1740262 RepID=A0ABV1REW4_9ALTE